MLTSPVKGIFRFSETVDRVSRIGGLFAWKTVAPLLLSFIILVSSSTSLLGVNGEGEVAPVTPVAGIEAISGVTFTAVPNRVLVGETVTFYAAASTDMGTDLTFTIRYDNKLANGSINPDSPVSVNVTSSPGSIVTLFAYDHIGNLTILTPEPYFEVVLQVTDGYTTQSKTIIVRVVENSAPYFLVSLAPGYTADYGVTVNMTARVADLDDDPITATWDFGDGSEPVVNETGPSKLGVTISQSHAWCPEFEPATGEYYIYFILTLTLEDGQDHETVATSTISIWIPYNLSPSGTITTATATVDPSDVVTIVGRASDPEGEALTWTFSFSNSTGVYHIEVVTTETTEPGQIVYANVTHVFGVEGIFNVSLRVSDALLPELQVGAHNISCGRVQITSKVNRIPYVSTSILVSPSVLYVDNLTGTLNVTFSVEVGDLDGDVLSVTWDFGDGTTPVVSYSSGLVGVEEVIITHRYASSGIYNMTLNVTDGRVGHEILRCKNITLKSTNAMPEVKDFLVIHTNTSYSIPGSSVGFRLTISDAEEDPVYLVWDFGDGSPLVYVNVTDYDSSGNASCTVTHVYSAVGDYTVTIHFTDNKFGTSFHNGTWIGLARISVPEVVSERYWNAWDYVGLMVLLTFFGLLVLFGVFTLFKGRFLDEKGLTWDEYRARKKEITAEQKAKRKAAKNSGGKV